MRNEKGNILVIVLAVFLVLAIGAAGFFFWQNQQLQNDANNQYTPTTNNQTNFPTLSTQDETASWKTFTFKENPASFKYPENLNLLYFPTDTTGKFETDRMASGENVVLKNGEKKVLGINPNQVGVGFSGEGKYAEEFLKVNGNQITIAGVPIKKLKSSDGSYLSLINNQGK